MALPSYGDIIGLLKKGMTVEAQEQIMALREGAMELQEENLALRKTNGELKAKLEKRGKVEHKPPFFYLSGEDKPLCPKCWQEHQRTTYLMPTPWSGGTTRHDCPVCKFHNLPPHGPASRTVRRVV